MLIEVINQNTRELVPLTTDDFGGGGGGGITQAQVKTAIETATTLDQIEAKLDALLAQSQAVAGGSISVMTPGFVTAATLAAASVLAAANANRHLVVITNTSGAIVYVRLAAVNPTASPGGFDLRIPVDGSLELSGAISRLPVRVIAPGATANLAYTEGT